jgi:hypothetical protein
MKKQRSIRPRLDNLEQKTLLSTGVAPHLAERALTAPPVVDVARPPVHLMGYVYSGNGTVAPMGEVHATLNLGQHVVTLRNAGGSVQVRLTNVHKYPNTFTARAFKIIKGTGAFKAYRGQGHTSLTAVTLRTKVTVWSESFYS